MPDIVLLRASARSSNPAWRRPRTQSTRPCSVSLRLASTCRSGPRPPLPLPSQPHVATPRPTPRVRWHHQLLSRETELAPPPSSHRTNPPGVHRPLRGGELLPSHPRLQGCDEAGQHAVLSHLGWPAGPHEGEAHCSSGCHW